MPKIKIFNKLENMLLIFIIIILIILSQIVGVLGATFGDDDISTTFVTNAVGYMSGSAYICAVAGTADNLSFYMYMDETSNTPATAGIYDNSTGTLIGQTEEKFLPNHTGPPVREWVVFNFSEPKPTLNVSGEYLLVVWSDSPGTIGTVSAGGGQNGRRSIAYTGTLPSPAGLAWHWGANSNFNVSSYCSYTESSGTGPSISSPKLYKSPTEWSLNATGVQLTPDSINVTISDAEGDQMNWSMMTNESGSWTEINSSASGVTNGTVYGYNTSWIDTYSTKYWISFNVSDDTNWNNKTYYFTTQSANQPPVLSNPNPANGTTGVSIATTTWNITIEDPEGDTFNWTIETGPDIGVNSSDGDSNGSKEVGIAGNLSYSTNYTIFVNATDGTAGSGNWTNETFWFVTENNPSQPPTVTDNYPANGSTDIDMYVTLNLTVEDPNGDNFNITWSTNASGSWSIFGYNSTCNNGTYNQTATWANESATRYWWNVSVNDTNGNWTNKSYHFTTATYSWSNWSEWWTFNYTSSDPPGTFNATTINRTRINVSWDIGLNADTTYVEWNTTSNWERENGTLLYNSTASFVNHTHLAPHTRIYYQGWGYNATENAHSLTFSSANNITDANSHPAFSGVYPVNESTGVNITTHPYVNLTITDGDGDLITWNITGDNVTSNEGIDEGGGNKSANTITPLEYLTTYTWRVNCTDGYNWTNATYSFTTESAPGVFNTSNPFPHNTSTEVTRPPTNLSINVTGNNINVTIYFRNMTPVTDKWTEVVNWTNVNTKRLADVNLTVNFTTEFIWGNTTYTWTVNATDGNTWINRTYTYTTVELAASSKNARYDVNNNDIINVFDLSADWAHETGSHPYDGLYDVNDNGAVNVFDLSAIWANRS